MADNRKYYYLKLKESYFDDDAIVLLESMPDGILYSNILLKLYLKSLKNGGKLQLDENIPYTAQMIATLTIKPERASRALPGASHRAYPGSSHAGNGARGAMRISPPATLSFSTGTGTGAQTMWGLLSERTGSASIPSRAIPATPAR